MALRNSWRQHLLNSYSLICSRSMAATPNVNPGMPGRTRQCNDTKVFGCRNDRFRQVFEQIWPTLPLTDDQVQLFRRNSKVFIMDLNRTITLSSKFNMGPKKEGQKVPYGIAKVLLYERGMHLDNVSENPRYMRVRRIRSHFGVQLQNVRKIRLLTGFQRREWVQKMYERSIVAKGAHGMWKFVSLLEATMKMHLLRMGYVSDSQYIDFATRGTITHLNGAAAPGRHTYFMQPGDIMSPNPNGYPVRNNVAKQMRPMWEKIYSSF